MSLPPFDSPDWAKQAQQAQRVEAEAQAKQTLTDPLFQVMLKVTQANPTKLATKLAETMFKEGFAEGVRWIMQELIESPDTSCQPSATSHQQSATSPWGQGQGLANND